MNEKVFDVSIIGGGLAGLTTAVKIAKAGKSVILFEKETYPFHKVCGEYISMESWDYLESLGLPLQTMDLPVIKNLKVSAPSGNILETVLPLGGFGISRYTLDNALRDIAIAAGVTVKDSCKVENVVFDDDHFVVSTSTSSYTSKLCSGSFGKRSNLDIKWKRPFINGKSRLNNFVAVKYHIEYEHAKDLICLHNFKNGYCGISAIENNRYCVCYLTDAATLKSAGSIELLEKNILSRNPHLKKIFSTSRNLYAEPLSISQISFDRKSVVENHLLMSGDAAGMIPPLCGNGMSMAIHAGKIAAENMLQFLDGVCSRNDMERNYTKQWNKLFGRRLRIGRFLQQFFGKEYMTERFISLMKKMPFVTRAIIKGTHGKKI